MGGSPVRKTIMNKEMMYCSVYQFINCTYCIIVVNGESIQGNIHPFRRISIKGSEPISSRITEEIVNFIFVSINKIIYNKYEAGQFHSIFPKFQYYLDWVVSVFYQVYLQILICNLTTTIVDNMDNISISHDNAIYGGTFDL